MNEYLFETSEFGLSDKGIHLLRSRFNYETIDYADVSALTIEKGKELNNWLVILIIGLGLFSFAVYYTFRLFSVLTNHEVAVISTEEILVPLIPFMMGGYCIYSSTRNSTVLRIKTVKDKRNKLSLKELAKDNKLQDLQQFLKDRVSTKLTVNT